MDRPRASSDEARIGSAAFLDPETRTSPTRRAPPRMTIFCKGARAVRLSGGRVALAARRRRRGRRRDSGVLVAQPALGARLPARFLAADLVAVMVAELG